MVIGMRALKNNLIGVLLNFLEQFPITQCNISYPLALFTLVAASEIRNQWQHNNTKNK